MGCDDCREAISADLDGEGRPGAEQAVAEHLDGCADCRRFAERAVRVTRLTRTRPVEPTPDLVAAVLAAAPPVSGRRPRMPLLIRGGLGAVGVGQFALAITGVLGAGGEHPGMALGASLAHFSHESSAWNLALAIGFLWAATGGPRVSGLLPVVGAFVGVLTVLSALDVVSGQVEPIRLIGHGVVVAGLALLIAHRRSAPTGGGSATGTRPEPRVDTGGSTRSGPRRWRAAGGDGLAPTAGHRAA